MKNTEQRLLVFEEKYGLLSRDFYKAMLSGELAEFDAVEEIRLDFLKWMGAYKLWLNRESEYRKLLAKRPIPFYVKLRIKSVAPISA